MRECMAYERGMTAIRWLLVSMTTLAWSSVVQAAVVWRNSRGDRSEESGGRGATPELPHPGC